jgi:hypothetical protein
MGRFVELFPIGRVIQQMMEHCFVANATIEPGEVTSYSQIVLSAAYGRGHDPKITLAANNATESPNVGQRECSLAIGAESKPSGGESEKKKESREARSICPPSAPVQPTTKAPVTVYISTG